MASGRLAAAVVPSGRTQLVYTNSSGGAVSATILTKSLSTTTDAKVSMAIDSASVTPETLTQIDTTSRNFETTPIVFFNSGNTAVEGSMTMLNTTSFTSVVDGANSYDADGRLLTGVLPCPVMSAGDKDMNPQGWPMPFNNTGSEVRTVNYSDITADLPYYWRISMTSTSPSPYQYERNLSYAGYGFTCDPYNAYLPFWSINSNGYMSWGRVASSSGAMTGGNRTSDSWYNQQVGGLGLQDYYRTILMARGGVLGYGSTNSSKVSFQIYKGWTNADSNNYLDPSNDTSSSYALKHSFTFSGSSVVGSLLKWIDYNPHTDKNYACFWEDGGYVMMEMDGSKLAALYTAHKGGSGSTQGFTNIAQAVSTLGTDNPYTDITSSMPSTWNRTDNNWYCSPTFRVGDKTWYLNEGNSANPLSSGNKGWITSDFRNWTEVTGTSYYSQTINEDTVIVSDADSTDKRVGNFSSVAQSGRLETDVTFSEIERTGLVLSNNDKLYVKNSGTVDVNIQVMGFEEGS